MVLVRTPYLRGEKCVGTKLGMKIGFVGGIFLVICLVKGRFN